MKIKIEQNGTGFGWVRDEVTVSDWIRGWSEVEGKVRTRQGFKVTQDYRAIEELPKRLEPAFYLFGQTIKHQIMIWFMYHTVNIS